MILHLKDYEIRSCLKPEQVGFHYSLEISETEALSGERISLYRSLDSFQFDTEDYHSALSDLFYMIESKGYGVREIYVNPILKDKCQKDIIWGAHLLGDHRVPEGVAYVRSWK